MRKCNLCKALKAEDELLGAYCLKCEHIVCDVMTGLKAELEF